MLKTDIFGINLLPCNKIAIETEILTYLFALKADGMVIATLITSIIN
jgi:hypothetical protein